ncbi:Lipoprotein-releasing system ATP-binding protein LolD [Pseudobythopirellula maris]|uniref:Lipoprotein-releasing system ATP-binding protein LolD n=1 Tax=Pseudobythopirellula maris TaxID=2527991 RepID=A0A5C5ZST6_9BACT|nr:ABC transporter ATP-binding protein [Pseudobythopirellula maris]TWT89841.1 Lipoprotein-releasing system ATP-binding protein LolD [Pseudobythopirellula maris]
MITPPTDERLVVVDGVRKTYMRGATEVPVLHGVDTHLNRGEFVSLIGPSGSGKSTLLNLIAGLDRPTQGSITIDGQKISHMDESPLARWRSTNVGFIFQFYHLIPVLTAYENVELPLLLYNLSAKRRREQVLNALELVGLSHRLTHRPGHMSGGEQQRVGIARALVTDPVLIVADEPTGDLDGHTSEEILDLLGAVHEDMKKTILLVTHDPAAASRAGRLIRLDSGHIVAGAANTLEEAFPGWSGATYESAH